MEPIGEYMEWYHVLGMVIGNLGIMLPLWLWNRAESRADVRHMDNKLDSNRNLIIAIHDEMKDFHYRLLEIERNRK